MKKKIDELLNSNYDGIEEYDNDLPKWWVILFLITIFFAVVYSWYFFIGSGPSSQDRLKAELAQINQMHQSIPQAAETSADQLLLLTTQPEQLEKAKIIFANKCAACHSELGQGLVGPNLTDHYWIHGGKITDIKKVIENGVLEKGMLSWKGILSPEEINVMSAYVFSIRDTNPPNAKAPEGVLEK